MDNQELVDLVIHDLEGARSKHDDQLETISRWISVYNGDPYGNEEEGRSEIVWKLAKKQGESLISNIAKQFLGQHQIADLSPLTDKDVIKASIYTDIINHFWTKDFNSNKFVKSMVRIAVKEGTTFVRVGWEKDIRESVRYCMKYGGMGKPYIFSASNCMERNL